MLNENEGNGGSFAISGNFKLHLVLRAEDGSSIGVHQANGHGVPTRRDPVQGIFGVAEQHRALSVKLHPEGWYAVCRNSLC